MSQNSEGVSQVPVSDTIVEQGDQAETPAVEAVPVEVAEAEVPQERVLPKIAVAIGDTLPGDDSYVIAGNGIFRRRDAPAKQTEATYPLYLADGTPLPEEGTYIVVGSNGVFLRKENNIGVAVVPATGIPGLTDILSNSRYEKQAGIPGLDEIRPTARFDIPKIPGRILRQAHYFFERIYRKLDSECELNLFYSPKLNEYRLHCPKQEVSHGSVNYDRTDTLPLQDRRPSGNGFRQVGTIHSHCNFSAFHSGTDISDETDLDGIHLTFGHVNGYRGDKDVISVSIQIVANSIRFKLPDYREFVEGLEPETQTSGTYGSKAKKSDDDTEYYRLTSPLLPEDAEDVKKNWIPKVSKRSWFNWSDDEGWGGVARSGGTGSWRSSYKTPVQTKPVTFDDEFDFSQLGTDEYEPGKRRDRSDHGSSDIEDLSNFEKDMQVEQKRRDGDFID